MLKKLFVNIFGFFFLFICIPSFSQSLFKVQDLNMHSDSMGSLSFYIRNSNFIKNNEYFNEIVEGYTLIGYWLETSMGYQISEQSDIEVGANLIRFSGREKWWKIVPTLSFNHQFSNNLRFTLGSIRHINNYNMPEPILDPERYYFNRIDNGAQITYKTNFIQNFTWLSWDRFIFYGDSLQEEITVGSSSFIKIFNSDYVNFTLPSNILITHLGGQINRPKQSIRTLFNISSGLNMTFRIESSIFESISVMPHFYYYKQLSDTLLEPFKEGYALHPQIHINFSNYLQLALSYWYNKHFIAPRGEPIYGLKSLVTSGMHVKSRSIGIVKIGYSHHFEGNVILQLGCEGYYFPQEHLLDYNFLIHLYWQFKAKIYRFRFAK